MHREQLKCKLRYPPLRPPGNDPIEPDFSTCSANLRAPKFHLLMHMIGTALADAWRARKNRGGVREEKPNQQEECVT